MKLRVKHIDLIRAMDENPACTLGEVTHRILARRGFELNVGNITTQDMGGFREFCQGEPHTKVYWYTPAEVSVPM